LAYTMITSCGLWSRLWLETRKRGQSFLVMLVDMGSTNQIMERKRTTTLSALGVCSFIRKGDRIMSKLKKWVLGIGIIAMAIIGALVAMTDNDPNTKVEPDKVITEVKEGLEVIKGVDADGADPVAGPEVPVE